MNIILFEDLKEETFLPAGDLRCQHIREVLKMGVGDRLYCGLINGPIYLSTILKADAGGLWLKNRWDRSSPPLYPLRLLCGLCRPQSMKKILQEATSLGVSEIQFFQPEKGEGDYRNSRLWAGMAWRDHLIKGAEQAFTTALPKVSRFDTLADALDDIPAHLSAKIALDIYEAEGHLASVAAAPPATLAIGPERGWGGKEREILRKKGFALMDLGERVLRTETACIAGICYILKTWNSH